MDRYSELAAQDCASSEGYLYLLGKGGCGESDCSVEHAVGLHLVVFSEGVDGVGEGREGAAVGVSSAGFAVVGGVYVEVLRTGVNALSKIVVGSQAGGAVGG